MRAAAGPRRAFTIIELLIVLAVLTILMGISYAGIFASRSKQGLVAGTELVTNLVRQARATALSTGTAVQLHLDATEGTITGVSQQIALSVDFETLGTDVDGNGAFDDPRDDTFALPGVSGYGWVVGYPGISPPDGATGSPPTIDPVEYRRAFQDFAEAPLVRGPGEGFLVECWIKPPPIADAAGSLAFSDGSGAEYLPVLRIGLSDENHDGGDPAYVGLNLRPVAFIIQNGVGPADSAIETRWTVEGWIMDGASPVLVTDQQPGSSYHVTSPHDEEPAPLVGGEWLRIGLLSDGQELHLLRDGVRFGSVDISAIADPPAAITAPVAASNVVLSIGTDASGGAATTDSDFGGIIDEIRVVRLGASNPARLPKGVEIVAAASPERLTIGAAANGTASVGGGGTVITLQSTTDAKPDGSYRQAVITISATGRATVSFP